MSVEQLVTYLTWIVYFGVFLVVGARALREPRRATIDSALFFLLPALIVVTSTLLDFHFFAQSTLLSTINVGLLLGSSYLLLRLVGDFTTIPTLLLRASEFILLNLWQDFSSGVHHDQAG